MYRVQIRKNVSFVTRNGEITDIQKWCGIKDSHLITNISSFRYLFFEIQYIDLDDSNISVHKVGDIRELSKKCHPWTDDHKA